MEVSERLTQTFLDLVRLDNPSGQEEQVVAYLREALAFTNGTIVEDALHNMLVRIPGEGVPILLNAHTDSVSPCIGVRPIVRDGVVYSSGDTVLGADDLAGVAAIVESVRRVHEMGDAHRPLELLFTAQEEVGLVGAKAFDYSQLTATTGVTFDMTGAFGGICLGGPWHANLEVMVHGQAAHAGIAPEKGISAIRVASEAIAAMPLGRIDEETTANVGIIHGGEANNIVPPLVNIRAEARSQQEHKLREQVAAMRRALEDAAHRHKATLAIDEVVPYSGYRIAAEEPIMQQVATAMQTLGVEPQFFISGGGSDVSIFASHGLRVANLSIGYQDIHSTDEHIALRDIELATRLLTHLIGPHA